MLPQVCSVCPDGGPYLTGKEIPTTEGDETKYRDLTSEVAYLDYMVEGEDCGDTFLNEVQGGVAVRGNPSNALSVQKVQVHQIFS